MTNARPRPKHRRRTPAPADDLHLVTGALIRAAREQRGISQTRLGAPYFTRAHVSAVELGKVAPSLKTLAHFATKLEVPLRSLIPDR
ncbi:MAG TPA: hypothetical protein DCK98_14540 [Chloroflexi bacterium]|jgi:transcriptional regulator with XRE-family HTH domain|nr:hypothetical protein [Chloroflexota bacterium]HAL28715.1 hypothetical protein [Chloroflexota bacterium]